VQITHGTKQKVKQMKKTKSRAFGKDVYLLGVDKYNEPYWLEHPSFDCGWYWGFGYLELYTNPYNPDKSRDIQYHCHWSGFQGKLSGVFTDKEYLRLRLLFSQFYEIKEIAEKEHRKNLELYKSLTLVDIPKVMQEILDIVSPTQTTIIIPTLNELK